MFAFKQFVIEQDRCAMKVGTDGVLLGAWARGGRQVLDVGTGTGVIARMMAQRYADAQVTAIDLDEDAVDQARQNVQASVFSERVTVCCQPVQPFSRQTGQQGRYDAVVSNPPFFIDALRAPDKQRAVARHADTLTYGELMQAAVRLLAEDGELSVVVPFDYRRRMDDEADFAGLFPARVCAVSTKAGKPPRRYLLAYRKHPCPCQQEVLTIGSEAYLRLTEDFYL